MFEIEKKIYFDNIKVVYDGSEISKKSILKNNLIMCGGCTLTIVAMFALIFAIPIDVMLSVYGIFLSIVGSLLVMVGGVGFTTIVMKFNQPKHYDFVTKMMRFKSDTLEFGEFNGRYIIRALLSRGWECFNLKYFIGEEFFLLDNDEVDRTKPLCAIIDCTGEKINVLISNTLSL